MIRTLLSLLILLTIAPMANAAAPQKTELDYRLFRTLPILDEGRMKPLQSFARIKLKELSGHESLKNLPAEEWLAQIFFHPKAAAKTPLFFLQNKTVAGQFELPTDKHLYTLEELQPGLIKLEDEITAILQQPEETLDEDQSALIDTYRRAGLYMRLNQTLITLSSIEDTADLPIAITGWKNLAKAYNEHDPALWQSTLKSMHASADKNVAIARFHTENLYRTIKPYGWVLGLYALGAGLMLVAYRRSALTITALALIAHMTSIAARIYILDRPPVGTLYESVLFVSLICAAIGALITARKHDQETPLIAGNIAAFALLAIAPVMAPQSDSLEVLSAVLNTNFWLGTHVLCITIGYGVCILAATLAHIALFNKALNRSNDFWRASQKIIYKTSLAALFFVTIGTILGGIWADQSWGRFWGWDPKENGALLIALWLIWLHHGKVSGHLKAVGFTAAIAALNIIVALAWFGVNLLSVGLHSYGFTSGMAGGLAAFCITETIIITILTLKIKALEKGKAHEA